MQSNELKKSLLELLDKDIEFRYTVAGYIGLEDIRSSTRRLEEAVAKLAESHARLNERVGRLEDAVAKLVEAQAATEKAVERLRSEVGKLSENFGFTLEEIAATKLPRLLKDDNIKVERRDIRLRHTIPIDGKEIEVDVYAEGKSLVDGSMVKVIGEVKGRIDASDVKRFSESMKGIDAFKFIFGHTIKPKADEEARMRGIKLYATWM